MSAKGVNFVIQGSNRATPAMRQFQGQMAGIQRQMAAVIPMQRSWSKGLSDNRRMVQQVGFQMSDFAVQIAGGQSAMLAFVQQGGQMLQFFGPFGAMAAAALTVFGTMAIMMVKTGTALNDITPIFGVFESELSSVVSALKFGFNLILDGVNLILNNLDVLVTAGAFFFGRWVLGWVLSTKVVRVFTLALAMSGTMARAKAAAMTILAAHTWAATTSMAVYRAAVIAGAVAMMGFIRSIFTVNTALFILRTVTLFSLIAALSRFTATAVVAFGTVAARAVVMAITMSTTVVSAFMSMFSATAAATGGLAAFSMTSLIASARMMLLNGAALLLRGAFLVINAMTTAAALGLVMWNVAVGIANAGMVALVFSFRALAAAIMATGIGALVIGAAYLITKLFELRQATASWAEVLTLLGDVAKGVWQGIWESAGAIPPALASVWSLVVADFYNMVSDIIWAWAGAMNSIGNAADSVYSGMGDKFWAAGTAAMQSSNAWMDSADGASRQAASSMAEAGAIVTKAWEPVGNAFQRIKDILGKDTIDVRDWFGGGDDAAKKGGGGADKVKSDLEKAAEEIKKIFDDISKSIETTLMTGFKAVIKGTKSLKDYLIDVLDTILDKTIELLMQPIFSGIASSIAGSIMGFAGIAPPPAASFAGGGFTGRGSRVGGVDGKGGFNAVLHPNESVIDHTIAQTQSGNRGSAGGVIHLYVHESEGFAAKVDARAEGVAIRVSTESIRQYDRKVLPTSVNRISNDPTYKAR